MGETAELQEEELEVLKSIYEGDEAYICVSSTKHQYKYGDTENLASRSCVLEINWQAAYPNEMPDINLDLFFNNHLLPEAKKHIVQSIKEEAENFLGMSMTYSLFEYVKENFDSLFALQPEVIELLNDKVEKIKLDDDEEEGQGKVKVKKEQMTKNQKRRMWDKGGDESDRSRGWDWIDVVKHLHQTGGKEDLE